MDRNNPTDKKIVIIRTVFERQNNMGQNNYKISFIRWVVSIRWAFFEKPVWSQLSALGLFNFDNPAIRPASGIFDNHQSEIGTTAVSVTGPIKPEVIGSQLAAVNKLSGPRFSPFRAGKLML
jgi:hypothetical protein